MAVATVVAITTVVVDTVATVTAMTEMVAVVTSNASLRRIAVTSKTVAINAHTVPQAKRKNGFVIRNKGDK